MELNIKQSYEEAARAAADDICAHINNNSGCLLCFAAGQTPEGVFTALLQTQAQGGVDLRDAYYVGLDEWVGFGKDDAGSCRQVMFDLYYTPAGIPENRICIFDGLDINLDAQISRHEAFIAAHGGISLAMLGIGMNGHIGFNEPFYPDCEGCCTVKLDGTTKDVSVKYFDKPREVDLGITIGMRTLYSSGHIVLIAAGDKKADIVKKTLCENASPAVPSSMLRGHPSLSVYLDGGAAKKL